MGEEVHMQYAIVAFYLGYDVNKLAHFELLKCLMFYHKLINETVIFHCIYMIISRHVINSIYVLCYHTAQVSDLGPVECT